MDKHRLGRKRLLDAQLAATYWRAGLTSLLTTNPGRLRSPWGVYLPRTC
jgi:hypothetical protein